MTERGGESTRSRAASTAPTVTCIVVGDDGGVHVVAAASGEPSAAGGIPDLVQLAAVLESAAAALRGDATERSLAPETKLEAPSMRTGATSAERIRIGQLEIYPDTRLVLRAGQPVPLSRIEFDLFLALVRRAGEPATRLELVREVWGFGAAVTSRSVDTQIYNLRHKLEENPSTPRHLLTVSGVGYRLAP